MAKKAKRFLVYFLAAFFIVLGIAGIFLPVLQGILFLAVGLIFLSLVSPRAHAWTMRHTSRYPQIHALVQRIEKYIVGLVGEV